MAQNCACPWCPKDAKEGNYSLNGELTCDKHAIFVEKRENQNEGDKSSLE